MPNDLGGMTVLVTRPRRPGQVLCRLLEAANAVAMHLPTLDFLPPHDIDALRLALLQLGEQDWLIFVSPQAVSESVPAIRAAWPCFPSTVKFAAIGAGTKAALQQAGYHVAVCPELNWQSEGLLALPAFQSLTGQKMAIICGEGGRDLLARTLAARGARVTPVVAYRRVLPTMDVRPYRSALSQGKIEVMVATSCEGVKNLKTLMGEQAWPLLKVIPLLVISERMKASAQAEGFQVVWVARNASHEAILAVLAQKKG
ncbi:MAG: hypothetical protein A3E85_04015 [Gammaproteobacteria bacterium RIFCSPHIGHO2_12_FULL_45_12]|nr:MAG: hypothetical protein A3E85_04015 [Gammaproteobacteria bacterium RIFCSPHIGHO2_12_FULL_45_12]